MTTFLMQVFFSKKENLSEGLPESKAISSKIALFCKASVVGATFLTVSAVGSIAYPHTASASFLGDVFSTITGTPTQADTLQTATQDVPKNSQTVPLLESNLTPELKNTIVDSSQGTVGEQAIEVNEGAGTSKDIVKYATTAKILTYIVKKGDTIDGIARKLKVSKDSVAYAADLEKGETLKPGQILAIIPVDVPVEKTEKVEKTKQIADKTDKKKEISVLPVDQPKTVAPVVVPVPETVVESVPEKEVEVVVVDKKEESTPAGQPDGGISGSYIWPFPRGIGRISQGLHADNAYDFAAPIGTPLYSVYDGSVLIARPEGYNGGFGKYVVIDFVDGRQAIFGHMSKVIVKPGDIVKKGEIIGYVGNTGKSTGPHLHLGFHGPQSNPYLGLKLNARDIEYND